MSSEVRERLKAPFALVCSLTKHSNIKLRNNTHLHHLKAISTGAQHSMSLLRPSIAGRLLRAGVPSTRRAVPATVRFESTALGTPLTTADTPSGVGVAKTESKDMQVRHNQPDYTAEVDQASS